MIIKRTLAAIFFLVLLMGSSAFCAFESDSEMLFKARRGDVVSMRKLGYRLFTGSGAHLDRRNGLAWLEKSARAGDTLAMYYLGRIYEEGTYVGQDKEKAKRYYSDAAGKGHEKAARKLAALRGDIDVRHDEKEVTSPENQVTHTQRYEANLPRAATSRQVLAAAAQTISSRAHASGVKSVSLVAFLCNGGRTNRLSTSLRHRLMENLTGSLDVYDRTDSKLVATEGSLTCNGQPLDAAEAVLTGEVFYQPGDEYGYFAYRVFRASDTRIVAAGCERIHWSHAEQELFNGSVRKRAEAPLSFIRDEELTGLANKVSKIQGGIAMVQNGGTHLANTLDSRIAYAQIVAAMMQKGCAMYEREFMLQAAKETGMRDSTVDVPSGVNAVGHIELSRSRGEENLINIRISAVPSGKLLSIVTVEQEKGADIGDTIRNNDENAFDSFIDELAQDAKNVKLRYQYEVIISEDYELPKDLIGEKWIHVPCVGSGDIAEHARMDLEELSRLPAHSMLKEFTKELYRKGFSREEIKKRLECAALFSFQTEQGVYLGPFLLSLLESEKTFHSIIV